MPGSTDVACIGSGKTVKVNGGSDQAGVVQGEGALVVSGGSLEVANSLEASTVRSLTLEGGTLTGAAAIDVTGTLQWGSGTMSGPGATVVRPSASGDLGANSYRDLVARALVNEGTTSLGQGRVLMSQGAVLRNTGTFVADSQNESPQIAFSPEEGAKPSIVNAGTFEKTGGSGVTTVNVPIENHGNVKTIVGSLAFKGGGSSNSEASWSAASGYPLVLGGGSFSVSGGAWTGPIEVVEPTTLTAEAATTFEQLKLESGTLTGVGAVNVSGSLSWGSGTMSGSGSTVVRSGASADLGAYATRKLVQRSFLNEGTTSLGQGQILMSQGAVLRNAGTFVADSQNESPQIAFSPEEGAKPSIVNTGTFEKIGGPGTTTIGVPFENQAVAKTLEGTLAFSGGGSSNAEAIWAAASKYAIAFQRKPYTINGGSATGTIEVNEPASLIVEGTVSLENLNLAYGTLTGAGTAKVSGLLTWGSAIMSGTGSTVMGPSSTADLGAYTTRQLIQRTFVNEGTTSFGQGAIDMSQGAVIRNTGLFVADSQNESPQIAFSPKEGASPLIVNSGTFEKTGGPGETTVGVPFENLGLERALEGKLIIRSPISVEASTQYGGPGSIPGHPCPVCGEPVVASTGNLVETQTDLTVGGRGVGLSLTRTYNSQAAAEGIKGMFGYGWSSTFSDTLTVAREAKTATLHEASGATVTFAESGGVFTAPAWSQYKLTGSSETGYTVTLPSQVQYKFQSSTGRLESITDRNGNDSTLAYNAEGHLETVTDPAGRKLTYAVNTEGLAESVKDPAGHEAKYTYEAGTLKSVILPGGEKASWQFKYDGSHQLTEMIDGREGRTLNEYNGAHQLVSQTDPMKRTLGFEYEAFHTRITNKATGAVTDEHFTSNDEPSSVTRGYGTGLAATGSWTYNQAGYVLSETDGNDHVTKYGYDAEGDRTSKKDADEHETKWEYNSTHDVIGETTPKGETTTIRRDSHGNPEAIERLAPGGKSQVRKFKWAAHGEEESLEDPLKRVWKYEYDSEGDRTAEIDPAGDKRTWEYDGDSFETATVTPRGHVKAGEEAKYATKLERDARERPKTITDPLSHVTTYKYDANGDVETVTDGNKHTTTYGWDSDGEQTSVKQANGNTTETEYGGEGHVIAQTDGNKHTTKYVRNILGQVKEVIDPLGHKTTKEYDAAGNVERLTDPAKRITSYTYDPANLVKEISYSDGKTHSVKWEYDTDNEPIELVDGTGTTTIERDQLERPTEVTDGHGDKVAYEWDLGEEKTKITYPNGKSVTQEFDNAGRLEKVHDWLEHTTSFSWSADSEPTTTTFPEGTIEEDKHTYNAADELTKVEMKKGAEVQAFVTYTRDSDGQVKTTTQKGLPGEERSEQKYDENNRLTKSGPSAEYKYDAASNPTKVGTSTETFSAADELEKAGSAVFAYGEAGERTKATPEKVPATSYVWNQAQALTAIERPEGEGTAKIEDSFVSNGDGLRTSQTINGATSYLTWDLHNAEGLPLLLNDGTNSYIYGPDNLPVEQISTREGKEQAQYLHHDQAGSTRLITSNTGAVEGKCSYSPYGTPTCEGAASASLGFDAQLTNYDTGLIYLRARVYDPTTAQFVSPDPLAAVSGEPYGYADDNPLNTGDPTGLIFGIPGTPSWEEVGEGALNVASAPFSLAARGLSEAASLTGVPEAAERAAQFWAELANNQCSSGPERLVANVLGPFAELATRENIGQTALALVPAAGYGAAARAGYTTGRDFTLTENLRVSLGNSNADSWAAKVPHYHRRITDEFGNTVEGGSPKWHRPWEQGP